MPSASNELYIASCLSPVQRRGLPFFLLLWPPSFCMTFVLLQEWWRTDGAADPTLSPSALSVVPARGPLDACPDQAHTWHLGVGQEFCGSMIVPVVAEIIMHVDVHLRTAAWICLTTHVKNEVLFACRFHGWPGTNIDQRLENVHASFDAWRRSRRLSTSVTKFELQTFKCSSHLDCMHGVVTSSRHIACMNFWAMLQIEAVRLTSVFWKRLSHYRFVQMALPCGLYHDYWASNLTASGCQDWYFSSLDISAGPRQLRLFWSC